MPTYEYRCAKCGQHVEAFQSFSDAPLTKHKGCGGKLTKILSPAGIVLKGSGFYKTDNRGSSRSSSTSGSEKSTSDTGTSSGSDGSSGSSSKSSDSGAKSSDAKSA
jgi:putative FmdB family regulatory protein